MIRVANAPCSWGVLEFETTATIAPASQVLDEMAAAGYAGTELGDWGFLPTEPQALAAEAGRRDLRLVGAFVPVAFSRAEAFDEGIDRALQIAHLLAEASTANDAAVLVLSDDNASVPNRTARTGRVRVEDGLSGAEWDAFAARAADVRRRRSRVGHRQVRRPHLARAFQGLRSALARTARAEGWDYHTAVRRGIFCELGRGALRFHDVRDALAALPYAGWIVVEQDVLPGLGTPSASAIHNREYLRRLGL